MYRLSQNRKKIKEYLKTATTILEQNQKDNLKWLNLWLLLMEQKEIYKQIWQLKKELITLNNKCARMNDLEAKKLIMEAEKLAQEEARKRLER